MQESLPNNLFPFDGSPDGWLQLFSSNPIAGTGVYLFLGGERSLDRHVAGWQLLLSFAVDKSGRHLSSSVEHILPSPTDNRDILVNLKYFIEKDLHEINWPPEQIASFLDRLKVTTLTTLEGDNVIATLENVENGAAVAVSCAHLYRYSNIDVRYTILTQTPVGIEFGFRTKEQAYFDHLMELTRQALKIARSKDLFITLFCEGYSLIDYEFPPDLMNDPDLVIHTSPAPEYALPILQNTEKWLKRAKDEGASSVLEEVSTLVPDPQNRALVAANLLVAEHKFDSAWAEVTPYLEEFSISGSGELLLSLCQIAVNAGKIEEGISLLQKALTRGINIFESLHSSYRIASALDLDDISNDLVKELYSKYPSNKVVLFIIYDKFFQAREFTKATEIAKKLYDPFLVSLSQTFGKPELDLVDLLNHAEQTENVESAYLAIAYEAEYRKDYELARKFAAKISLDSQFLASATQIRIRSIGRIMRQSNETRKIEASELKEVMKIAANFPQDVDLRFEIENLLESGVEEPSIVLILSYILLNHIRSSFAELQQEDFQLREPHVFNSVSEENEIDVTSFFREFLSTVAKAGPFVIGQGEIPDHLRHLITPSLIRDFIKVLQELSLNIVDINDVPVIYQLLHAIVLACREIGDPSSDFIAVRVAISGLALAGYAQQARDLAETSLLLFPKSQSNFFAWRLAQAWSCYADAFHRTGNYLAALRCLCFSSLSGDGLVLNGTLLTSFYRLTSRVFRDLGLSDFALDTVKLEREAALKMNVHERFIHQLDQIVLSIKISELSSDAAPDMLLNLLLEATELIEKGSEKELSPVMSLQAHLMMILKLREIEIPNEIEKNFFERLDQLDLELRNKLKATITTQPTKEYLLSTVKNIASANHFDDLAYQITPFANLIKNSIKVASQNQDIEFFILAMNLSSQPVLTLRIEEEANERKLPGSAKIHGWWVQFIVQNNQDGKKLIDAQNVVHNVSRVNAKTISKLTEVSLTELQAVIKPEEGVLLVGRDVFGNIHRSVIYSDDYEGPGSLDSTVWSSSKFQQWQQKYPREYGMWTPPRVFEDEYPSKQLVDDSLQSLSLGNFKKSVKSLSIVTDTDLFSFPFAITWSNGNYLSENLEVATVPSISWMIKVRTTSWSGAPIRKAWLGSSTSDDLAIHFLRDRLSSSLRENKFQLIDSEFPYELANSEMAFIVSHGGVGLFDRFRGVSDATITFSAEEFARILSNCGCVVLFVCNSGRSDPQIGSSETIGLVSALLRSNVRCVVAPPWPLHINVAELWLPPFLKTISLGYSIGYSAHVASREVSKRFDNPCAWGALHVYGDGSFIINS